MIRQMCRKILSSLLLMIILGCGLASCVTSDVATADDPQPAPMPHHRTTTAHNNKSLPPPLLKGNLWERMRRDLTIPTETNRPEVQARIRWFQQHQAFLNRAIGRSAPYIYYIYQQTQVRHLPADLALIPIVESNYNPTAYNVSGASGLWQIMPGTAANFGLKHDWWYDGRHDVVASTNAALDYFNYLHSFFDNDWLLAIAAYDTGPGNVQRRMRNNQAHGEPYDFWHLRLPAETLDYVPRLLALAAIIENPERYGIQLLPVNDAPYIEQVNVGMQIGIAEAAKLAGVSVETLRRLNPGYRHWATDPDGPYTLLLPVNNVAQFKNNLAALPPDHHSGLRYHVVQAGETLEKIAERYQTTAAILRRINKLRSNSLRPHQGIMLPGSANPSLVASKPITNKSIQLADNTDLTTSLPAAALDADSQTDAAPAPVTPTIYHVRKGDTLGKVASKYHVSVSQLRVWNHLGRQAILKPGMRLIVDHASHAKKSAAADKTASAAKSSRDIAADTDSTLAAGSVYQVAAGDDLTAIARRFHTTVEQLRRLNHLRSDRLKVGQHLRVPGVAANPAALTHRSLASTHAAATTHLTRYTVRPGDRLAKIARRFKVSINDLKRWNHLSSDVLRPGKKLVIYSTA